MLNTFDNSSKFSERRERRNLLLQEMERHSTRSLGVAAEDNADAGDLEVAQGEAINSKYFDAARELMFDDEEGLQRNITKGTSARTFDTASSSGSGGRRTLYSSGVSNEVYVNEMLHDVTLVQGGGLGDDDDDSLSAPTHGGFCTRLFGAYHDNIKISKRACWCVLIVIAATAFIIGISVGVANGNKNNDSPVPATSPSTPTMPNDKAPAETEPVLPPKENTVANWQAISSTLATLLVHFDITTLKQLEDVTSPQRQALEYMLVDDLMHSKSSLSSDLENVEDWTTHAVLRPLVETYVVGVLFYTTGGENWANSDSWEFGDRDFKMQGACRYKGITCTAKQQKEGPLARSAAMPTSDIFAASGRREEGEGIKVITGINMTMNAMDGEIPKELALLEDLQLLDLSSNLLRGEIPPEFASLKHLEVFGLAENELRGQIDGNVFKGMSSLMGLSLASNFFYGPIPDGLGELKLLEYLDLSGNELSGTPPDTLLGLVKLQDLILSQNELTGELPDRIGEEFPDLKVFALSDNQFHGAIPSSLASMEQLETLELYDNDFDGEVPQEFCDMLKSTGAGKLEDLEVDCEEKVTCDCCTFCY